MRLVMKPLVIFAFFLVLWGYAGFGYALRFLLGLPEKPA